MVRFILRILGNSIALYAATWLVPGFVFSGGIREYLYAGVGLGLMNVILKPIIKFFTFPFIILTLGLFTIVINALILWLVDYIFDFIEIGDIVNLIWATIVISIVNMTISALTKND
jgi:putative membrane protein